MDFRAYFKHMETSLPLYAYAERKIAGCVEKYVHHPIEAYVMFSVDGGSHKARCHVLAGGAFNVQVDAKDDISMYSCVDRLEDKLDQRLRKMKERVKSHKQRDTPRTAEARSPWAERVGATEGPEGEDEMAVDAAYVINFEKARQRLHAGRSI